MKHYLYIIAAALAVLVLSSGCGSGSIYSPYEELQGDVVTFRFSSETGYQDVLYLSKTQKAINTVDTGCTLYGAAITDIAGMQVVDDEANCTDPNHCAIIVYINGNPCTIDADIRAYSSDIGANPTLTFDIDLDTKAVTDMASNVGAIIFTLSDANADYMLNQSDLKDFYITEESLKLCDAETEGSFAVDTSMDPWIEFGYGDLYESDIIREFIGITDVKVGGEPATAQCTLTWTGTFSVSLEDLKTGNIDLGSENKLLMLNSELCTERDFDSCDGEGFFNTVPTP